MIVGDIGWSVTIVHHSFVYSVMNYLWPLKGPVADTLASTLAYLELVYFVTALVPSLTACLASSPGSRRRTAVCISRLVMVDRLL